MRRHRYLDVCAEEDSFQVNGDVADVRALRGGKGGEGVGVGVRGAKAGLVVYLCGYGCGGRFSLWGF